MKKIQLKGKHGFGKELLLDNQDYEDYKNLYLWVHKLGYIEVQLRLKANVWKNYRLSRLIMDCPKGMVVDHINHNQLDNRRSNLRICTQSENNKNRRVHLNSKTGYKGIFSQTKGRYFAQIKCNRKTYYLGTYSNIETARGVYDEKVKELHKEFAVLNKVIKRLNPPPVTTSEEV
jgi:hypothetical protein